MVVMIAFGHSAVGAMVGIWGYQQFAPDNLALGLGTTMAVGIASHYIADLVPHGHFFTTKNYRRDVVFAIIFDLFLSVLLFSYLFYLKDGFSLLFLYFLAGLAGSQLPDVLDGSIYAGFIKAEGFIKYEFKFHNLMHWHGTGTKALLIGIWDIWQVLVVILAIYLITKL